MSQTVETIIQEHQSEQQLHRHLSNRHIQLIAIGGAIGTGLFMGSGRAIHLAGPSIVFVYLIIGAILFLVMRAMGEVLLSDSRYGTFSDFVSDLVSPAAGFMIGWTYWLCWIVTGMAEVIAISDYCHFWWPHLPAWIPALITVAFLIFLNLLTVKAFGETEFWFSMIKIVAIIGLIGCGVVMVLLGFKSAEGTASVSNLWSHPGPNGSGIFPNGLSGFVGGFQMAVFSFVGIELVGTTAAETKDPEVSLPKAINSIPVRILLFYVLALLAIMMVVPWNHLDPETSPFVKIFSLVGLTAAASLVNLVVMSSAASSCNSGIYSTSRMMYALSLRGDSPRIFQNLSARRVPNRALYLTGFFLLLSVPLMLLGGTPMKAFTLVTSVASMLFMAIWLAICLGYIMLRVKHPQRHRESKFRLPGGYAAITVIILFILYMLVALFLDPETRLPMLASLVWFAVLGILAAAFYRVRRGDSAFLVGAGVEKESGK